MKQDVRKRLPHYRSETNLSRSKMSTANRPAHKANPAEQSLPRECSACDNSRRILSKAWTTGTYNGWRKWSWNQVLHNFSSRKISTPNNQSQYKYKRCTSTRSKPWPTFVGITNLLKTRHRSPNPSFQEPRKISTTTTWEFSSVNNLSTNLKVNVIPEIAKSFLTIDTHFSIFYFFIYCYGMIRSSRSWFARKLLKSLS